VLSVNTGAWEELGEWALGVDPFDVPGQADALERALGLVPDDRRARLAAISTQVRTHDLAAWIHAQLDDLDRATSMRS
jgi:trehalose 6-phosphate synthase